MSPEIVPQPPRNPRPRAWIERVLLGILIVGFAIAAFIPAWNHLNSDFPNYYLVARLYRQGYPLERVYEWVWFQRQWDHIAVQHSLIGYQPLTLFSALTVAPLSSLPPLAAKRCWLLLNVVFVLLTALLLKRCTALGWVRVLLLIFLAFFPLRSNFIFGQMHVLVLLLLTIAAVLYFKRQDCWSGISLALAAALKIYPALFLVFFVIKKRWGAASGLLAGLSASALLSLRLFGLDACRTYVREVLPWAMRSQTIDPYNVAWGSLNALLARLFVGEPELNPSPVAHLPWLYALLYSTMMSVIVAAFVWAIVFGGRESEGERPQLEWASFLFLLLLVSSQPAPYHFVSLILPAILISDDLLKRKQTTIAASLIVLYVLACGSYQRLLPAHPVGWQNLVCFPRLFVMLLFGGLLLHILIGSDRAAGTRVRVHELLPAAAVFCVLFVGAFASQVRHFRGQFDDYSSRVLTVGGSLLATDPVIAPDHLYFTALAPRFLPSLPDFYAVHELREGNVASVADGGEWFHPAVGKGPEVWAEAATRDGSRIVRFSAGAASDSAHQVTTEVEDAEQPVISADEAELAFTREVNGRNSLWTHPLSEPSGAADHQVAGPDYDVREANFFPDHRIVFSSRRDGRFRLYVADPASGIVEEMKRPTCSARYPSISPDGKRMAFSCEQGGYWQLHSMDLVTGQELQLTYNECNRTSPVWTLDSQNLIYATDCGRGLGFTALAKLTVPQ